MKIIKNVLKSIILPCLVWAAWSCLACGQESAISPELMKEITDGHARLKEYTQTVSGKIFHEDRLADEERTVIRSFCVDFYCQPDTVRLVYNFPREENLYGYMSGEFRRDLGALYLVTWFDNPEYLQKSIKSVENISYDGIDNALCITSKKLLFNVSTEYEWKIILNPEEYYSLIYYEHNAINKQDEWDATISIKITSQTMESGEIFPREIIRCGKRNGKEDGTESTRIDILSTK
ncbi:MAG: hypothetical protein Q4G68_12495 [Planctomycetia bacterium]|nr:hypothetical protein [Planctomycetia bacterium]